MLDNHVEYKYKTPYKGPFFITQCLTNDMVTVEWGEKIIRYIIRLIEQHTSDTNIEDIKI